LAARNLTGLLETIGAAFGRQAVGAHIRERGGEDLACVEGNQRGLRDAVADVFERAGDAEFVGCDMAGAVGAAHGRAEERSVTVIQDPSGLPSGGADVGSVARVCRERQVNGQKSPRGAVPPE
jgi:hypothetical protein